MTRFKFVFFILLTLSFRWHDLSIAREDRSQINTSIIPGVVLAKLKSSLQFHELMTSLSHQPQSIFKIERALPHQKNSTELSRIYKIYFPKSIPPAEIATALARHGFFEYVEPCYISYVAQATPDDSLIGQQSHLNQIKLFFAWDIQRGAPNTIIAIVDNGTEYTHPDLRANIWTNPAEALGKSGVDDDGNGFLDDIHGWDFGNNDNDPTYGTDAATITVHGTHTAGIASAVTNNTTGVAGVGWNCSIMPVKASTDDNTNSIPFGYEGIVYAADNGARIISNSWGRSGEYSHYEQDIINYAVAKGCIIVAAGGNLNTNAMFFPAHYRHVIAVAAVNDLDQKASYASFGKYIDLSAPGGDGRIGRPGIFSTFPVERGSYGELSGSSMAAPIVAGLLGLLVNQFPEFSSQELTRQVVLTADNIDPLTLDYQRLLGRGRVNAYRALTESALEEEPAKIKLFRIAVYDSVWGNKNFLFERNETIGVDAWYQNFAVSPGRNMSVSLSTDDPDLLITRGQTVIDEIPADEIFAVQQRLAFQVKGQATPHLVRLFLDYSFRNGVAGRDTVFTIIGKSTILLVDDDTGSRNVEGYYETVLNRLGVAYLRWDHALLGSPPSQMMPYFPTIIWFCEWAFPSLVPEERIALQNYLDRKGNLFISGQDVGWDLADPTGVGNNQYSESAVQFYQQYLHSTFRADHSGSSSVMGMPGTIGQDLEFDIYQPKIAYHFQYPEWIEPTADAALSFQYENGRGAGVSYAGDYRVLNLGFGFEAIDAKQDEDPARISRSRMDLMSRILDKSGPLDHEPIADRERQSDNLILTAQLSPLVNDLQSLSLFWKTDAMSGYAELPMSQTEQGIFRQQLDLVSYQGRVHYFFKLTTSYFTFFHPVSAPDHPYSFLIGPDKMAPEIRHVPLPDIFSQNADRAVQVFVEDNVGVNAHEVWLHYNNATQADSARMIDLGNNWYRSFIPPLSAVGDSMSYFFSAQDFAAIPNRSTSPSFSYQIGFEGFENGADFWVADSNSWALDDESPHSGRYCLSAFPGTSPTASVNVSVKTRFGFRRSDLKNRILSFWTKYELEKNRNFGYVEISLNDGARWEIIGDKITGIQNSWSQKSYDLHPFYIDSEDTLLLRFRMQADSIQNIPLPEWSIDDVAIEKKNSISVSEEEHSAQSNLLELKIHSNSPNPFNQSTRINYELPVAGEVSFEVYNLLGQLVQNRLIGKQQAGRYSFIWDATELSGRALDSGIYFSRLIVKNSESNSQRRFSKTIKMIYLQ